MTKVLVATDKPFAASAVNGIREIVENAGFELALLEKYPQKSDLLTAIADADAVIVRSDIIDAEVIAAAKKLRIIVRAGSGYDNVDCNAASENNMVVMTTPGQNANAVAELAIGMMIYLSRNLFNGSPGTELKDKTLGIHAFGYIGKLVAKLGKGFGMTVYAYDPFVPVIDMKNEGVIPAATEQELYSKSQYLSVHLPINEKTKKVIGYDFLSQMPKNAMLVNTARKEIIDEAALLKVFAERTDFRYASDVEPDCKEELNAKYPGRFYFTPKKMGAQTAEANNNAGIAAARQIVSFFTTGDKTFQVNK